MTNIKTNYRCTNCWPPREMRIVTSNGHCVYCGEDVHRRWPWNDDEVVILCPVTDKSYLDFCGNCGGDEAAAQRAKG